MQNVIVCSFTVRQTRRPEQTYL